MEAIGEVPILVGSWHRPRVATQMEMLMSEITEQQLADIEALFVQNAAAAESDGATLTLRGIGASTIYFSDRPLREVGHMTSARFVEYWGEGDNSFQSDPPNAVLSYTEGHPGAPLEDAVVTINDPQLQGDVLSYRYTVLDGTVPSSTGPVVLFIDPIGRPLSPGSAAGVRRRERRRR